MAHVPVKIPGIEKGKWDVTFYIISRGGVVLNWYMLLTEQC